MKKSLTFLWILIIAGTAFIAFHKLSPPSGQLEKPENLTEITLTKDNQTIKTDKVVRETNKTAKDYVKLADEYLADEYYEKAIKNYEKALGTSTNSLEILIKLGETYLKNNQPDKARDIFNSAAKIEPDSIDIQILLVRSELNAREIQKAKEIIWSLDQKPEKNNLVTYYKGIILILYKDLEEAKKQFISITKATPPATPELLENSEKFLAAYETYSYYKESEKIFLQLLLAKTLTAVQENEVAIPLLYDILNTKNNYRDAWIVLGYAYLNISKPDDAIDALTQAKDLTPEKPETLFFLGLAYFTKNDIDKAIYYIEQADKYGYEPQEQIDLKLGDLYLLKEKYSQAAKKYETVLSTNNEKLEIFVRAVWLNIDKLNNPQKALTLAEKAQEKFPGEAMSYNLLGWSYTALGDFEKAKENLKIALSTEPELDAANLNFGWLYEKHGNALLAKEYYKKAYFIGKGNSIGTLAAARYNKLTAQELQNYQVDISAPVGPVGSVKPVAR